MALQCVCLSVYIMYLCLLMTPQSLVFAIAVKIVRKLREEYAAMPQPLTWEAIW
jgi:hypothetical protein